jgi:PAS domain S-box-containing protein
MAQPPASPDLLAALLESVADAVYLVDADGAVRFVNHAGLEILGYDREEELLGRPSHATIHHSHPDGTPFPEAECPLLRPRTTGETVREEDWFVRRDGSFVPIAYSSAPVAGPDGRGAVVVFRDVTAQRAAAEQHARAEAGARAMAAADAERRRIGRDIHDGAQQRLVHAALSAQHAIGRLDADPVEARALLRDVVAEIHAANDDLRELAAGIHPPILTTRGLAAALDSLAARAPVPVDVDAPDTRFRPELEAAAYFVVAEALANVAKHAGATEARVTIAPGQDILAIEVRDDGRGGADLSAGSGLSGLKDRVETLGGTFALDSPAAGGTRVSATFPF